MTDFEYIGLFLTPSSKAVEIEESEFLRITKLFEEFQNIFKQIKDPNN